MPHLCFNPLYFFPTACDFAVTELLQRASAKELVRNGLTGTFGATPDSRDEDQLRVYSGEGKAGVGGVVSLGPFLRNPHTAFSKQILCSVLRF